MKTVFVAFTLAICAFALYCNVADAGSSYIRWGRQTCRDNAVVVYKGYVAGPYYQETGGSSKQLCISERPQYGNSLDGDQGTGNLWGTQLRISSYDKANKLFSKVNNGGNSLYNIYPVCALCYVPNSSDNFMIPGRQDCGEGNTQYNLEYKGYLMSGNNAYQRIEPICVDEAPESRGQAVGNDYSNLIYAIQYKDACKSLPCPEFTNDKEVTCSVCSI